MGDLIIDDETISRMRSDLGRVRREFENANQRSDAVAEAVGHGRLADRVRGFAHNWDRRRQDLVEQLTTIEGQLDNLQQQFDALDGELTSGLEGG